MDKDREDLKKELLEELKQEYKMIPIKEARLEVSDILEKYYSSIAKHINSPLDWSAKNGMAQSIRKAVCMHFGYGQMREIPREQYKEYRDELERFINDYILGGK